MYKTAPLICSEQMKKPWFAFYIRHFKDKDGKSCCSTPYTN